MKPILPLASLLALTLAGLATEPAKPMLKVAADGYPAGHATPEGAACDLARAFIQHDGKFFQATCLRLYAGGTGPAEYANLLQQVVQSMQQEAEKKEPSSSGPKAIVKVFAARHLSKNGPASYGYATFQFQDIVFVDVGAALHDGHRAMNRTLVIKDKDGLWYADPMPTASPLLCVGLNEEAASTRDFSEAYEVQK